MKTYHQILVLLLVLTLGTTTACGSDEDTKTNNKTPDSGLVDTDNTDDKDVDNTDNQDTDNKDTDSKDTDDKDTDDKDTDDKDTDDKDTELPPEEDKTPLKDLTEDRILELCAADTNKINDFFDTANDTGIAYCLLYAAYAAYDTDQTPAEMIGDCEATMASCTGDYGSNDPGKCINQVGCNATVADFERCSNDNVASFALQTDTLLGKTCSDYTTEDSYESLDIAVGAYESPKSCNDLVKKCPQIYNLP